MEAFYLTTILPLLYKHIKGEDYSLAKSATMVLDSFFQNIEHIVGFTSCLDYFGIN